jgi:DNA repair exonuclease SbcCD ATPase subunit
MPTDSTEPDRRTMLNTMAQLQAQLGKFTDQELQIADLKSQLSTENANYASLLINSRRVHERVKERDGELITVRHDLRSANGLIGELREQLNAVRRESGAVKRDVKGLEEQRNAIREDAKAARARVKELEEQNNNIQEEARAATSRAEKAESQIESARLIFETKPRQGPVETTTRNLEPSVDQRISDVARHSLKRSPDPQAYLLTPKRSRSEKLASCVPKTIDPVPAPRTSAQKISQIKDDAVTVQRLRIMKQTISNIKKSANSEPFLQPVDIVKHEIPDYYRKIKKPMDLGQIDQKLRDGTYMKVSDFRADFGLIISNCMDYNGMESDYTRMAIKIRDSFANQMRNLPGGKASMEGGA